MTETVYFKRAEQCERNLPQPLARGGEFRFKVLVGRRCRLRPLGRGDGPRAAAEEFELHGFFMLAPPVREEPGARPGSNWVRQFSPCRSASSFVGSSMAFRPSWNAGRAASQCPTSQY